MASVTFGDQIKIDASLLASVPPKRHTAPVTLFAITDQDGSPEVSVEKYQYIETLKSMIQDLRADTYYFHTESPKGYRRSDREAGRIPGWASLSGAADHRRLDFYSDLIQRYTIRMYEE